MNNQKRFGVALSGGGYRAAAFHLGTLKKLNELHLLEKVDVLSTISGGSITGAAYCLHQGDFDTFLAKMKTILTTKDVIGYVLLSAPFIRALIFCLAIIITSIWLFFTSYQLYGILLFFTFGYILIKYQFRILPISSVIEKAYDKFFYNGAKLSDLRSHPEIAIGSTNLQTLRHFTFSKRKMEDSAYANYIEPVLFRNENFPVAKAVMASSCVPFAFSPVSIPKEYFENDKYAVSTTPQLVDGGVYDNQGIHKLTQENSSYACDVVLVSDAGNKLPFDKQYNNTFVLLLRTVDTFMGRIKNFQMIQNTYRNKSGREVAYQSLSWDLANCVPGFIFAMKNGNISELTLRLHNLPEDWVKHPAAFEQEIKTRLETSCNVATLTATTLGKDRLKAIRLLSTNLRPIGGTVVDDMILHAANLTEIQLRLYCPSLFI